MKKRFCLILLILTVFLLPYSFAGSNDEWIECKKYCGESNYCTGSPNSECCKFYDEDSTENQFCCAKNGWQSSTCPLCTDLDGDKYIRESTAITLCGLECGPNGDEQCIGNNDCNDDIAKEGAKSHPGKTEICDNKDNNCDGTIDERCDDDKDTYADKNMICRGSFLDGNNQVRACSAYGEPAFGDCHDGDSKIYPNAPEICDNKDNDCDGIKDEGCDDDNDDFCDANMKIEGTPKTCNQGGGDCNDNDENINPMIEETCDNGIDDNCNGNLVAALDNDATTGIDCFDLACTGKLGPNEALCCQTSLDCNRNTQEDLCVIETCQADKTCNYVDRNACDNEECIEELGLGFFCDKGGSQGGTCQTPDASATVCSCGAVTDKTTPRWTATNHEDAGKDYGDSLFDSDGQPCTQAEGGYCYDSNGNTANHKSSLSSSACCGNDPNEFYKSDYYGGECTNDINDCVWSSGQAQGSNTGNNLYWCYLHEWNECIQDVHIGKKVGGVTCAGISGDLKWTPNSQVKGEHLYSCSDNLDNDGDGTSDCQDSDCAGQLGPGSVTCCQTASNCAQNNCIIESCVANTCQFQDRGACDNSECSLGSYCDAPGSQGGTCQTPDISSAVCLNCIVDQTQGKWDQISKLFQDDGIGFGQELFDSDSGSCPATSCREDQDCTCFDNTGTRDIQHKSALTSGFCCGDDPGEYYKPDLSGGSECVSDSRDCVWSTGDAQKHDSGNEGWWCAQGRWDSCISSLDVGKTHGTAKCAGSGTGWTIDTDPENTYPPDPITACSDGLDNDADKNEPGGGVDCTDSDCAGTITGHVQDNEGNDLSQVRIDILKGAIVEETVLTDNFGNYIIDSNLDVICGDYDIITSKAEYVSETQSIDLQPNENKQNVDFTLVLGTACEADCTYAGDNTIHQECRGINGCDLCNFGCGFCDPIIAASSCDLAQPGWIRNYDDPTQQECEDTGCVIDCGQGCPIAKVETKSDVTCDEENLIKITKLVTYKGKLAKLVIVTCG